MSWKYVVIRKGNQEIPVIFPDTLVHADMAEAVQRIFVEAAMETVPPVMVEDQMAKTRIRSYILDALPIVSAGEIDFRVQHVGGRSLTLNINSRPPDRALITTWEYTKGVGL